LTSTNPDGEHASNHSKMLLLDKLRSLTAEGNTSSLSDVPLALLGDVQASEAEHVHQHARLDPAAAAQKATCANSLVPSDGDHATHTRFAAGRIQGPEHTGHAAVSPSESDYDDDDLAQLETTAHQHLLTRLPTPNSDTLDTLSQRATSPGHASSPGKPHHLDFCTPSLISPGVSSPGQERSPAASPGKLQQHGGRPVGRLDTERVHVHAGRVVNQSSGGDTAGGFVEREGRMKAKAVGSRIWSTRRWKMERGAALACVYIGVCMTMGAGTLVTYT
jgi:hypothetical protein